MSASRNEVRLPFALIAVVALTIIHAGTFMALFASDPEADIASMGTKPFHWAVFAGNALLSTLVVLAMLRVARGRLGDLWGAFDASRDLPWALAAFAGACVFPIGVTLIDGGPQAVIDGAMAGPLARRAAFVAIGLMAAFAEESVFRGSLQPALVKKMGAPLGIFVGCVIFSLYHAPRHPFAFVGRILTGAAYGTTAHRTGALWAGAIGHFCTWVLLGAL